MTATALRVLFGTTNQAKLDRLRAILQGLPVEVLGLRDAGVAIRVEEDGVTPRDNAVKKASSYHAASGLPTFSIDAGLHIDRFPDEQQPGLLVRRMNGREATDAELLEHYCGKLAEVGGESSGYWVVSVAFAISEEQVLVEDIREDTYFKLPPSPVLMPGAPLSSIQFDATFRKYKSEVTAEERASLDNAFDGELFAFLSECIARIR